MAANVESMFYVREKPWHGLGTEVKFAPPLRMLWFMQVLTGRWNRRMSTQRTVP